MDDFDIYNKEKSNKNWIILIVIVGIIIFLFFLFYKQSSNENIIINDSNSGDSGTGIDDNGAIINETGNDDFIEVILYDKDGNIINLPTLSMINNIPNVGYITLTTTVTNKGTIPLSCRVVSTSHNMLNNGDFSKIKSVPIVGSKKASWTTPLIELKTFEGSPSIDIISISMNCSYNRGVNTINLPEKKGYISLTVLPDLNITYANLRLLISKNEIDEIAYTATCGNNLNRLLEYKKTTHSRREFERYDIPPCPLTLNELKNYSKTYSYISQQLGNLNDLQLLIETLSLVEQRKLTDKNICLYKSGNNFFILSPNTLISTYSNWIIRYFYSEEQLTGHQFQLSNSPIPTGGSYEYLCSTR